MNAPAAFRLPMLPAPPNDPLSAMLCGRIGRAPSIGWRVHRLVNVDAKQDAIRLAPAAAAARWMSEPSGSFGGLRPPANVAVTAGGDILLLDRPVGQIKRFDSCACAFATIPCVAGLAQAAGSEVASLGPSKLPPPRDRLLDPQGIAICGHELFIADRGHHRILRFAIGGWVPRGPVRLPPAERTAMAPALWQPTGIAFDSAHRMVVTDPVNGRVDLFSAGGRWLRRVDVEPGASLVAVDCRDRILVVVEREVALPVASTAAVTAFTLDGGSEGFQWHTLRLAADAGAYLTVDVHVGDEAWSAATLADPGNALWSRWLDAPAFDTAATPRSLGGRTGRYLHIRLTPVSGHVPGTLVATAVGARIVRLATDGTSTLIVTARADLVDAFGRPPIAVDKDGNMLLPCADRMALFDRRGLPATAPADTQDRLEREGRFFSAAIDSAIESCLWHRIELHGAIPPGCTMEVLSTSADIALTPSELDGLPSYAWTRCALARAMERDPGALGGDCIWDALLTPPPGRFLWLQIILRGEGRETPCLAFAIVEYPRISLRRYLPAVFGADPAGADFTDRFAAIFERTLATIERDLDQLPLLFDPLSAPTQSKDGRPDFLSWIGDWLGVSLSADWPEARRRHFIKAVAQAYPYLGTPEGLRRQLLLLLGFDTAYAENCLAERPQARCVPPPRNCAPCPPCDPAEPPPLLLEHFKLRRWLHVGRGRLGSDAELWGRRIVGRSELAGGVPAPGQARFGVTALDAVPDPLHDPFRVYAHRVSIFVPAAVRKTATIERALDQLVRRETPAHVAADIRYVEPRFRVGVQAMIGLDSVIARTPLGVTLDGTRLRQGSVLTGTPRATNLAVGNARLGTTTRLT